jgi:hypothetical protein
MLHSRSELRIGALQLRAAGFSDPGPQLRRPGTTIESTCLRPLAPRKPTYAAPDGLVGAATRSMITVSFGPATSYVSTIGVRGGQLSDRTAALRKTQLDVVQVLCQPMTRCCAIWRSPRGR